MNNLRNKVQLIGNLGQDVDYKKMENGKAIARVSLATKEVYHNQRGEKIIEIHWHHLVGNGSIAEFMQVLLKKGTEVAVQGKLRHHFFEDVNGNVKLYSEVLVTEFMLLN